MSVFRCRELYTGAKVLYSFSEISCWSPEHYFFLALGGFGLMVYAVLPDLP